MTGLRSTLRSIVSLKKDDPLNGIAFSEQDILRFGCTTVYRLGDGLVKQFNQVTNKKGLWLNICFCYTTSINCGQLCNCKSLVNFYSESLRSLYLSSRKCNY